MPKTQLVSLKESANILHSNKNSSEFELVEQLSFDMLTSYGLDSASYGYKIQSHEQIAEVLNDLASKIGMVQTSYYFRAGRNYFTINHAMGKAGNLFFKSVFDNLLKGCSNEKPHVITDQKSICVIFRI